ncbi:MAG TPA: TonB-dependent receptor [Gammaproteobacteria bacterium]|nr:TonB-dependent receptor [Gammaproteobacteria bacterium]HJM09376.1 TonB-dependent receptor [Gammaproteobacteria bacterium]|tara:strand:+ start:10729 stop:12987 length:2259 start_codon:yes stop_codon:yes gene_type:complete
MRTNFYFYVVVLLSISISNGLSAQDSIEEITVTSSYINQSADDIKDPLHVISEQELDTEPTQSLGESIDNLLGVSSSDYGAAVGQPIIRGMSGSRVKVLSNGLVVRDISGLGADHLNEIDMNAIKQIEIVRGPSSLMYSNGAIGGIVNVVDDTIAKENFAEQDLRLALETQSVNDGKVGQFSYKDNLGGLNISYAFKDGSFKKYDIPMGAVIHSEEHEEDHEDEHHDEDENHDEDHDEDLGYLENSDYEAQTHRFGLSTVGDWGHFGASFQDMETLYGIPYHGEGHEDHDGDHEDEEEHDEHGEEERIFSTTDSETFNVQGSYVFSSGPLNRINYYYRNTDYSLTEQHAEEEHEDEDHDEGHEGDHDDHGHEEGPTLFSNEADEFGLIVDFGDDSISQKMVFQNMSEDVSILGAEAFMNPVDSSEKMIGYYVGTRFMGMDLDLGIRHDRVNRRGTVAHQEEEEHHDEDEDHDEDHDEHEVEAYDIDRNETSLALSLGSVINENTSFNFGLASVKRAPSAVELFMNGEHLSTGRFEVGDASLKSETSNNIDFTLDYENNGVFASATIFRNNIDDYIYLRDETEAEHEMHEEDDHEGHGGLILSNYMQKDAEFNGYEFEIGRSLNFNDGSMTFSYGMDYVNAKFKDGTYVPRINPRRHIFTLTYAKDETSASMTFRNVTSQSKLSLNETPTESYKMVDLKLSQRIPIFNSDGEMLVTLFAKNLLDEVARNHSSFVKDEVPLPGRNIGLRFNMKF